MGHSTVKVTVIGAFCALALALCAMLVFAQPAHAISAYKYDSGKALSYAKTYANKKVPGEKKQDCVLYVKKCLEAGGVPADKLRKPGYNVTEYLDYLTKNNLAVNTGKLFTEPWVVTFPNGSKWTGPRTSFAAKNTTEFSMGDVLAYKCNKCGKWFHVGILAGTDGDRRVKNDETTRGMLTYYAHNPYQDNKLVMNLKHTCGASDTKTDIYVFHITSAANGYQNVPLKAPSIKEPTPAAKSLKIKWKKKGDVDGYEVRWATSIYMMDYKSKTVPASKSSYTIKKLKAKANYRVQVRSYKVVDGFTYYSDWSKLKTKRTK